jgi:hypothetical protein
MNDIVHRLLNWYDDHVVMEVRQTGDDIQKLMTEAAEEIERLRGPDCPECHGKGGKLPNGVEYCNCPLSDHY